MFSPQLGLLVVDETSESYYRKKGIEITSAMAVATMTVQPQKGEICFNVNILSANVFSHNSSMYLL